MVGRSYRIQAVFALNDNAFCSGINRLLGFTFAENHASMAGRSRRRWRWFADLVAVKHLSHFSEGEAQSVADARLNGSLSVERSRSPGERLRDRPLQLAADFPAQYWPGCRRHLA